MDLKYSKIILFAFLLLPVMAFAAEGIPGAEDAAKWFTKDILLGQAVFWFLVAVFIITLIAAAVPNARIGWGAPITVFVIVFAMYMAPWLLDKARKFAPESTVTSISEYTGSGIIS